MNKTEHYQLNQWDAEDRILRADFNADNAAIEVGMKANADAIAAETSARTAADTAIRTDFAAADTAIRSEFAAADTKIRTDFAAADTTIKNSVTTETTNRKSADTAIRKEFAAADEVLRSENMMVLLSSTTTTTAATQINVSVSSLALDSYSKILIIPDIGLASVSDTLRMRINKLTSAVYYRGSTVSSSVKDFAGLLLPAFGHSTKTLNGGTEISMQLGGDTICGWITSYGPGANYDSVFGLSSATLAPSAISTINFYATSGNSLVAGSKIRIYGVK